MCLAQGHNTVPLVETDRFVSDLLGNTNRWRSHAKAGKTVFIKVDETSYCSKMSCRIRF